jgi:hypothetical protein
MFPCSLQNVPDGRFVEPVELDKAAELLWTGGHESWRGARPDLSGARPATPIADYQSRSQGNLSGSVSLQASGFPMALEADRPGERVEVQADQSSLRRNRREVAARAGISETGKRANPDGSGETNARPA